MSGKTSPSFPAPPEKYFLYFTQKVERASFDEALETLDPVVKEKKLFDPNREQRAN